MAPVDQRVERRAAPGLRRRNRAQTRVAAFAHHCVTQESEIGGGGRVGSGADAAQHLSGHHESAGTPTTW